MAIPAFATASAATTGRDTAAAASASAASASVFLVPFRWWARVLQQEEDEAAAGGVHFAATATDSPCWYGLRFLHGHLRQDLVLRFERGEYRAGGKSYALVPADELSRALGSLNSDLGYAGDGDGIFAYPLMLRISVQQKSSLIAKISRKDNVPETCKRAAEMFATDSQEVHVWDFSGLTNLMSMNEQNSPQFDCCHTKQETHLVVEVYEVSDSLKAYKTGWPNIENSESVNAPDGSFRRAKSMGLIGLENLGNTCYMNSSVQCLAHTPKLVSYFLHQDSARNLQRTSTPRPHGGLALAFGKLLRSLWSTDREPVSPVQFKEKVICFAPQYRGSSQHDSHEFLDSLLDGLHEDLNQVNGKKPYQVAKDASGRADEVIADEHWTNYLAQNKSVIVDLFLGQYKSTLRCATCNEKSITFDPFTSLSLPVPSMPKRAMIVTVFCTDGICEPSSYEVIVPKFGHLSDLLQVLSIACSLGDDEFLLITEVHNNCIIRYLEEPSFSLALLLDVGALVAYRLQKENVKSPLVVFSHQYCDEKSADSITLPMKKFGVPLLAALPGTVNGLSLLSTFIRLLSPFQSSKRATLNDCAESSSNFIDLMDTSRSDSDSNSESQSMMDTSDSDRESHSLEFSHHSGNEEFEFYLKDGRGDGQLQRVNIDELDLLEIASSRLHVIVRWQLNVIRQYDTSILNNLPGISKGSDDSPALHGCLEAFLKEETLELENMWYCPHCKGNQEATKKLDLWRLPEVLVIHLKRFSHAQLSGSKIETFVDFPSSDLDMSVYAANKCVQPHSKYRLYAVSEHFGNMEQGHYTASIYEEENGWYKFDDGRVTPTTEDCIRTPAAYILFYRRQ